MAKPTKKSVSQCFNIACEKAVRSLRDEFGFVQRNKTLRSQGIRCDAHVERNVDAIEHALKTYELAGISMPLSEDPLGRIITLMENADRGRQFTSLDHLTRENLQEKGFQPAQAIEQYLAHVASEEFRFHLKREAEAAGIDLPFLNPSSPKPPEGPG